MNTGTWKPKRTLAWMTAFFSLAAFTPAMGLSGAESGCQQQMAAQAPDAYVVGMASCVTSAWDPASDVDCLVAPYDEGRSTGDAGCGTDDAYGTGFSSSDPKCGYGWAQAWAVKVELSAGDAEVNGHILCNGDSKADCTIHVGGVKVCEDDGGSEKGPLVCGYTIGEIAARPLKGVIKCTDPANPAAVVTVGFEILSSITGPVTYP